MGDTRLMRLKIADHILALEPYVPGKPIEELEREYGIANAVKLASNENPLGPSPKAVKAIRQALKTVHRYPNGSGYDLLKRISQKLNVPVESIVLGNGSDDIISMLAQVLLQPGAEAVLPKPSFLMYELTVSSSGATPIGIGLNANTIDLDRMLESITSKTRLVFLNNPHNPTGTLISKDRIEAFIAALPSDIVLVIDEAYIEFVRERHCPNSIDYVNSDKVIVGLRTFSKAYGLAGLRIGYGVMPAPLADLLNRVRQPFNVNSLAQAAAIAAIDDEEFLEDTVRLVHDELEFMYAALDELEIDYIKSQANFFMINVRRDANQVFDDLLKQGIIVRSMTSYGYPDCIRVNVGRHDENVRFLKALKTVL